MIVSVVLAVILMSQQVFTNNVFRIIGAFLIIFLFMMGIGMIFWGLISSLGKIKGKAEVFAEAKTGWIVFASLVGVPVFLASALIIVMLFQIAKSVLA